MLDAPKDFVWWFGVVEDVLDPQKLGRVRVRVFGWHTADLGSLPVEALPWASCIHPVTTAGVASIGTTPTSLLPGSHVVGFFLDGKSGQIPVVWGCVVGMNTMAADTSAGFGDPSGKYPLTESEDGFSTLDESQVNRLARGEKLDATLLKQKAEGRDKDIITSLMPDTKWSEPVVPNQSRYPYNKVSISESGHVEEIDDTPGAARTHRFHPAGTFTEVHNDGTLQQRIVGDHYEIVHKNGFLHVKGICTITVDKDARIYVGSNALLQCDGDLTAYVAGKSDLTLEKKVSVKASQDLALDVGGKFSLLSKGDIQLATEGGANILMSGSSRLISLNGSQEVALSSLPTGGDSTVDQPDSASQSQGSLPDEVIEEGIGLGQ